MAISFGNAESQDGYNEDEERRKALELLIQQKIAEDSRNIRVRGAAEPPPSLPRDTHPKIGDKGMAALQDALLRVREGDISAPTQEQKDEIRGLLLGTPEENAAREAEYAESDRIKRLIAARQAAGDTGSSVGINPITGQPAAWTAVPEGFERTYSERQKQQISQLNNAIQDIENNPNFDKRDKEVAIRKATIQLNNIKPSMRVKEPPPPMGDSWESTFIHPETGALMGYDRNRMPRILVQPQYMPDYLEAKNKLEREKALLDAHSRRVEAEESRKDTYIQRLVSEQIEASQEKQVPDPKNPGKTVTIKETVKRYRTPEEVAERMATYITAGGRAGSVGEKSIMSVATPEQLKYGPSGIPYARGPQAPPMSGIEPAIATPRNQAEYDALPVGAAYIGRDGQPRRKQ